MSLSSLSDDDDNIMITVQISYRSRSYGCSWYCGPILQAFALALIGTFLIANTNPETMSLLPDLTNPRDNSARQEMGMVMDVPQCNTLLNAAESKGTCLDFIEIPLNSPYPAETVSGIQNTLQSLETSIGVSERCLKLYEHWFCSTYLKPCVQRFGKEKPASMSRCVNLIKECQNSNHTKAEEFCQSMYRTS